MKMCILTEHLHCCHICPKEIVPEVLTCLSVWNGLFTFSSWRYFFFFVVIPTTNKLLRFPSGLNAATPLVLCDVSDWNRLIPHNRSRINRLKYVNVVPRSGGGEAASAQPPSRHVTDALDVGSELFSTFSAQWEHLTAMKDFVYCVFVKLFTCTLEWVPPAAVLWGPWMFIVRHWHMFLWLPCCWHK